MSGPALLIVSALLILWWGITSVLAFRAAGQLRNRIREAPEDLQGVVRSTSARHGSHALLRVGLIAALLDVVIDGEVDWAVPVIVATFVLFIGALLWNAAARYRRRGDSRMERWVNFGSLRKDDVSDQDEMASQPYEDPGWLTVFNRVGIGRLRGTKTAGIDGVVVIRLLFLSLLLAALLILFVLSFIIERVGVPDVTLGSVVAMLGVAGIAAAAWTANRKLDIRSASALADSYRTNFFLGFALNEAPLLISFVFCFIEKELWPYLIALPLYLIGMALIAPGRRNLERRQEQVHRQGSTLSLGRAVSSLPGHVRG